jgi:hypothetical protein
MQYDRLCTQKIKEEWSGTISGVSKEISRVSATCGVSEHFFGFSEESTISQKKQVIKQLNYHTSKGP